MRDVEFERLMLRALECQIGAEFSTTDVNAFKRRFYAQRSHARERGDLTFDALSCVTSPSSTSDRIWLIKKSVIENGISPATLAEAEDNLRASGA